MTSVLDALQRPLPARSWRGVEKISTDEIANRVLNSVKFTEFIGALGTESPVLADYKQLTGHLEAWMRARPPALSYAWLYANVMARETNLLFEQWYGTVPPLEIPDSHLGAARLVCEAQIDGRQAALEYLGLLASLPRRPSRAAT